MGNYLDPTKGTGSPITTTTKGVGDLIEKGQNNQKGLIGVIALGVLGIAAFAINAISKSD